MGKFMQRCALTALFLIVLGLGLALAAGAVKGTEVIGEIGDAMRNGDFQEGVRDVKDWGMSVKESVMEELNQADYDLDDTELFDREWELRDGDVDREVITSAGSEKAAIENLDIQVGGCSMEIADSGDDNFYLTIENGGHFQKYVKGNTLYIKFLKSNGEIKDIQNCTVILYVPEEYYFEEMDVSFGAGALELGDLTVGELEREVGAGKVTGGAVTVQSMECKVGAGSLEIENLQTDTLSAEVGMGNFDMKGEILSKAEVECAMGNITMQLAGSETDYNYDLQGAVSNVRIGDQEYSGISKERQINNSAAKSIEIECAMGNVELLFDE